MRRRWLRVGLESKEAVSKQAEGPPSLAQAAGTRPTSQEGVPVQEATVPQHAPHSTLSSLQGDGGDSVLAAAADLAARGGGGDGGEGAGGHLSAGPAPEEQAARGEVQGACEKEDGNEG